LALQIALLKFLSSLTGGYGNICEAGAPGRGRAGVAEVGAAAREADQRGQPQPRRFGRAAAARSGVSGGQVEARASPGAGQRRHEVSCGPRPRQVADGAAHASAAASVHAAAVGGDTVTVDIVQVMEAAGSGEVSTIATIAATVIQVARGFVETELFHS